MPRPPRTRVASRRTAHAINAANPSPAAAPTAAPTAAPAPAPAPAPPTERSSSDIYDVSDREKEKSVKRRQSTRTTSASSNLRHEKALETARQRRDSAMDRLENMTSTTSDDVNKSADTSDESIELGRKTATPEAYRRLTNVSGLDLDDDMFADLDTTLDTAGPASAQRSNETSTLSTSHFRRRPRAGSFLSRDDGPIRPSSRTGPNTPGISSTFNIGLFKRRAREPSILGTAQKPRPQRPEPERDTESSEHEEAPEENMFAPEAECTPFKHSKRRSGEVEVHGTPTRTSLGVNTRKRKSSEGHEQRSRSSPYAHGQSDPVESIERSDSETPSQQPSLPPLPRDQTIPTTPIRQEDDEELLAPPLSSGSSDGGLEVWPPLQSLARGRHRRAVSVLRRTPVPNDNTSDISSPPSLTYSPNYPETSPPPRQSRKTRQKAAAAKPEPKITTADLAGMLPRRRRRNARDDPFGVEAESEPEVDASGLGNDEDELSYLDVHTRRRPARSASRGNKNAARGRSAQRARPSRQTPASGKATARTYGRLSDKENQNEPEEEDDNSLEPVGGEDEDDSHVLVAKIGSELKNAKRKFQEVDKWTLEYEEMTQSSSPRGAR